MEINLNENFETLKNIQIEMDIIIKKNMNYPVGLMFCFINSLAAISMMSDQPDEMQLSILKVMRSTFDEILKFKEYVKK